MASLSLPRVLHSRKTSLEIERENFEKSQYQALSKAINSHETPVKQKHVRSAIIGTFHTQGASVFWSIALRLPALDDRITAWKLCHVVHKILREGHPLCLVHSQRHRKELDEIGKLWVHLREGYGKMIRLYTSLLMTKLDFHRRNPRFPGHLGVTPNELESMGGNDINNYFEMTVEMFDYLDNILDLQAAVFGSLDMARSNSMTSAGQCRLAPLIPCIQDASKLYDYCVKMLFKLHFALPPDTLSGHRHRFLKQFKLLKQFYQNTSNLQYFKDLIAIPPLPENPPNFLVQSDLRTYVTQEVVVPQEAEEPEPPAEGSLIDTSEVMEQLIDNNHMQQAAAPPPRVAPPNRELINERDFLQSQCEKLSTEINTLLARNQREVAHLQQRITTVETELATKESELLQERHVKEDLMNQAFNVAQSQDSEQKVRDEKFNKLKDIYVKLRDDHIQKLRERAEIDKKLASTIRDLEEAERNKIDFELKMADMQRQLSSTEKNLQEMGTTQSEELDNLKRDKELFNMETEILKKSVTDACKERDDLKVELQNIVREKEELRTKSEALSYKLLDCERRIEILKKENDALLRQLVTKAVEESKAMVKFAVHEIDNPAITALSCSPDYLRGLTQGCMRSLQDSVQVPPEDAGAVIVAANQIAHRIAVFILQGRATCNKSPDINFGEKMAESCRVLGEAVLELLNCLQDARDAKAQSKKSVESLEVVMSLAETINASLVGERAENLADMIESEMLEMDKAIEEAARQIQDMLTKSRAADSGIKLEVNSKLLDSCTDLMHAIRILVQKSRLLQGEIVAQGRGTASAKEFYKRNHQWTDGFISAAKAVAVAAKFLLTTADKVVTSNGKLEQIAVAAQEIAASTAQLVVASRVKADRNSGNLKQLTQASKGVSTATGTVVATVKDCSQLIDEAEELDTSSLTLHQAKKLEIEAQVRVLELEKELEQERFKLSALRKRHYQLAGE